MAKFRFYNPANILSKFRAVNISCGTRSTGKTYGWSRYLIKRYIEKGDKFVWMRRTDKDIERIAPTWFDNIQHDKALKGHKFSTTNKEILVDDKVAGYFVAVSQANKYKSVAYEVENVVYDEFLADDMRYLGRMDDPSYEPRLVMNFMRTVSRRHNSPYYPVRLVLLANHISIVNPYFTYFGLDPYISPDTQTLDLGSSIYLEMFDIDDITSDFMKSPLGQVMQRTPDRAYSEGSSTLLDNNKFIIDKPTGKGNYQANLVYQGTIYALWLYGDSGYYYITTKGIDSSRSTIAMTGDDHNTNYIMINMYKDLFKSLKGAYECGAVRFDGQRSKKFFERAVAKI